VIVYATGFRPHSYLFPMTVTGREGLTVDELWAHEGARAYIGCMIPGFPNLWCIYGPNTNGGLLPADFHELVTRYALQCIERLILDGEKAVEVTGEAYRRYNRLVDETNAQMVWSDPRGHSYFTSEYGRSITQLAIAGTELWQLLRHPDFDDLTIR
jgi:4-hydroxyacetophenone monooxygenase